MKVEAVEEKST